MSQASTTTTAVLSSTTTTTTVLSSTATTTIPATATTVPTRHRAPILRLGDKGPWVLGLFFHLEPAPGTCETLCSDVIGGSSA